MNAAEVKDALRRRHPAIDQGMIGEWTCLEEWCNVDLLALSAWRGEKVVGYEVKVSRGDLRSELLNPAKRAGAVAGCHEFYLAVPEGLMTAEEIAWDEPDWEYRDFDRPLCANPDCDAGRRRDRRGWARTGATPRGARKRGTAYEGVTVRVGDHTDSGEDPRGGTYTRHMTIDACCAVCRGYGTIGPSRVEVEAPMAWVPKDVGLVVVTAKGCRVAKPAPKRKPDPPLIPKGVNRLVRWASMRPDPRHRAVS